MKEYHILNNFVVSAIVIGIMGIYAIGGTADRPESFLDCDALYAGWQSTYRSVKTMRVSYSYRVVDYKPPNNDPNWPAPVMYGCAERVEDGKRYHMRYSSAEDGFDRPESLTEFAFDGKISRGYFGSEKSGTIELGLTGKFCEDMNRFKDFTLTKLQVVPDYFKKKYPNGVTMFDEIFGILKSSKNIRPYLETVAGEPCHVVEITYIKGQQSELEEKDIFWIAHDKGMCLMKYQKNENNRMTRETEVEQIAMADMDDTAIWYPVKVRRHEENDYIGNITEELIVKQFIPNAKVDENTFRFEFPPDTRVVDKVVGLFYTMSGGEVIGYTTRLKELDPRKEDTAETKVPSTTDVTDDQKEKGEGQIPIGSAAKKYKMVGVKILVILGVVVLAELGLLFWYKKSAN
jgi:hypothetical protein